MAINKKLIHFQTLNNFEQLLSAGNILDTSICFIKDAKKIWTHGCFYDCVESYIQAVDTSETVEDVETNTYVKYVAQFLSDELKELVRLNIGAVASDEVLIDLSDYYTKTEINNKGYITDISNKQDKITDLDAIRSGAFAGATAVQHSELSSVAISGNYNDLVNKPTVITENTVSAWGFTKNTGTYSKPSTGIPKTDLASSVQTSLGKADTALLSYTEQYKGTITGVSANGTSVATSGVANIPAASTSAYGVTKLSSSVSSTSTVLAATSSAVKSAYDLANSKLDKLVSGTSIKTINGESVLGSGDIVVQSGLAIELIGTSGTIELMKPDAIYYTNTYNPNIIISGFEQSSSDTREIKDYKLHFYIGETLPTITLPSYLKWANGEYPTFEINTAYELAITATVTYVSESSTLTIYKAVCIPFILDSIYG